MSGADRIVPGAVIEVAHPFVREDVQLLDADGPYTAKTWRPGVRFEARPPYGEGEAVADGIGTQIVTVVSTHRPGRFPERVFYTRRWRAPNGHEFGKPKLHMISAGAFRRMIRGYRHEFELAAAPATPPTQEALL